MDKLFVFNLVMSMQVENSCIKEYKLFIFWYLSQSERTRMFSIIYLKKIFCLNANVGIDKFALTKDV